MKTIIIAGGGTGGHIYPALTIAKAIQSLNPELHVEFVGTPEGLESKIIPKAGFKITYISVGKLNYKGGFLKKIKTILQLPWAFVRSLALVIEKKPILVLGVGGYASGPFVLASSVLGIPTALWEPNAYPGMTNRILSRFVRKTFLVFEESRQKMKAKRIAVLGLPVREEIEKLNVASLEKKENGKNFRILIFGGSQGARAINQCVSAMINKFEFQDVEIVHQTGPVDFQGVEASYQGKSQIKALEYLYDIENYYLWADLVICRAGASTLAELAAARKPSILVPLPSAADDHQKKNALSLVEKNAARMIEQKDLTPESLFNLIVELRTQPGVLKKMSENVLHFYQPQAAKKIAEKLINLQFDNE
ncbi:MAG: undecaprenyldiphospho-muramoylpentapeptide beta-N-acetylglucosaminyltransferase [Bdellovibrionaceae bacterium]|nr:undecaprenyldiphospho-muramoylpentapeptide beta-N-acetylglucosaminyltransferase [Pseudobdellovibrionaceae bacterium]